MGSKDAVRYQRRLVDAVLPGLLEQLPALMLTGPRAVGKTTTALNYTKTLVRLDVPAQAGVFEADPDAALGSFAEPILLDEFQQVPSVLGAVKRAVDSDPRPGRFLLTGSVDAPHRPEVYAATGRVTQLAMSTLTVRELEGQVSGEGYVDRLAGGDLGAIVVPDDPPDLRGYVDLALQSGFPEAALQLRGEARTRWLQSYLDHLVSKDAQVADAGRDPLRLTRYLHVLALSSAGVVVAKTMYDAAGIDARTADAYERLLERLFIVHRVPVWATNRLKRLTRLPKRYITDTGLLSAALRLDASAVLADGDLLGRILDTFVAAQLRAELDLSTTRPRLYHVRDKDGRHEVDLLADLGARGVVAIEVKATASPTDADSTHLIWLRDKLGKQFLRGAILHTGLIRREITDRVYAVPICSLWG